MPGWVWQAAGSFPPGAERENPGAQAGLCGQGGGEFEMLPGTRFVPGTQESLRLLEVQFRQAIAGLVEQLGQLRAVVGSDVEGSRAFPRARTSAHWPRENALRSLVRGSDGAKNFLKIAMELPLGDGDQMVVKGERVQITLASPSPILSQRCGRWDLKERLSPALRIWVSPAMVTLRLPSRT